MTRHLYENLHTLLPKSTVDLFALLCLTCALERMPLQRLTKALLVLLYKLEGLANIKTSNVQDWATCTACVPDMATEDWGAPG